MSPDEEVIAGQQKQCCGRDLSDYNQHPWMVALTARLDATALKILMTGDSDIEDDDSPQDSYDGECLEAMTRLRSWRLFLSEGVFYLRNEPASTKYLDFHNTPLDWARHHVESMQFRLHEHSDLIRHLIYAVLSSERPDDVEDVKAILTALVRSPLNTPVEAFLAAFSGGEDEGGSSVFEFGSFNGDPIWETSLSVLKGGKETRRAEAAIQKRKGELAAEFDHAFHGVDHLAWDVMSAGYAVWQKKRVAFRKKARRAVVSPLPHPGRAQAERQSDPHLHANP